MDESLAVSWGSVENAQRHINDLEREIGDFSKKDPYEYTVEQDSQTGLDIHKLILKERLPRRLPYLAFDAAVTCPSPSQAAPHLWRWSMSLPGPVPASHPNGIARKMRWK